MKKIKNVLALLIIKSLDVLGVFQGFRYTVLNLNRILEKNYPIKSVFNFIQVGANDGVSFDTLFEFVKKRDVSGILITRIAQLTEDIVTDAIVVDSKMYKEQDGRYTCYTLVEKSRSAVLNKAYSKTISDDDKMKILFEKKKIEEDYEKFKASQKN